MRQRQRRNGYILMETIVAVAVLAIGVLAVNRALHQALLTRAISHDYTQARFLIEEVLMPLEMQPILVPGSKAGSFGDKHPRFQWSYEIKKVELAQTVSAGALPAGVGGGLKPPVEYLGKIAVTVSWTRMERKYERTVETLISPEKLYVAPEGGAPADEEA